LYPLFAQRTRNPDWCTWEWCISRERRKFDLSFLSRTRNPTSCDSCSHTYSHLRHKSPWTFFLRKRINSPLGVARSQKGRSPFGRSGTSTRV